jgi:hypothetical protein
MSMREIQLDKDSTFSGVPARSNATARRGCFGARERDPDAVSGRPNLDPVPTAGMWSRVRSVDERAVGLETARTIGKLPGFDPVEIPAVLDSFKSVITYTLDVTTEFPVYRHPDTNDPVEILPSIDYGRFVQLVEKLSSEPSGIKGVSIITFNYDIALDFALRYFQVHPNYCLSASQRVGMIKLFKLHGSLNWGRVKGGDRVLSFDELEAIAKKRVESVIDQPTRNLKVGIDLAFLMKSLNAEIEAAPVIVPPGFYKAEQHEMRKGRWKKGFRQCGDSAQAHISTISQWHSKAR